MSRDESVYDGPEDFRPERYLGLSPDEDPTEYIFGHGRRYASYISPSPRGCYIFTQFFSSRICPGRALGDSSAWLAVVGIAACFDIRKARDSAGREITPPPDFLPGFTRLVTIYIGKH